MANALDVTLHSLGQEVASGSGAAVDIGSTRSACRLALVATEVTGGSLLVIVESSVDGSTGWRQLGAFGAIAASGTGKIPLSVMDCDQYVRVSWTLSTSATFRVEGSAHTLLADPDDVYAEVPQGALGGVTQDMMADSLIKASCDAEDQLAHTRDVPLTKWSAAIRRRVAAIAVYLVIKRRGFNPDNEADQIVVREHDNAQKWLRDTAKDMFRPQGVEPTTGMGPRTSSGNPDYPTTYAKRMSDNWGDF